ncbi:flippase [Colwellia echini]|uniref:Flippase n=1 Tax=Colwellia echini TaxID=1982103 RepID=A0ABY3MU86_9GAMM|nr:flippase [Colwellia echini]TYK64775.1 flippase [Colwellia echini]
MSVKYNLKKGAWYAVENVTMIMFGLLSVILVARIFGPESLGKLSLVQAITAMLLFTVVLGLDHIIVRDIARTPKDSRYISTVFILQALAWSVHSVIVFFVLWWLSDNGIEKDVIIIFLAVIAGTYFSRATVLKLYFQAINQPKKIGTSAVYSRLLGLLYLAWALLNDYNYEYIILFIPVQTFFHFLMLLRFYLKEQTEPFKLDFDLTLVKKLLTEALPLLAAAALFPVFMQADILLIAKLLGEYEVGIYSASSRLITQLVFLGHIITMTFYLALSKRIDNNSTDEVIFTKGLIKILFIFGFVMSLAVSVMADFIIELLYGESFKGAGDVLAIIAWKWVFIFPAALFSRLLILKGLMRYELIKSLVVAAFSLTANYLLIPVVGITGAAVISVLSYFIADYLIYSAFKPTRDIFKIASVSVFEVFFKPRQTVLDIRHTLGSK